MKFKLEILDIMKNMPQEFLSASSIAPCRLLLFLSRLFFSLLARRNKSEKRDSARKLYIPVTFLANLYGYTTSYTLKYIKAGTIIYFICNKLEMLNLISVLRDLFDNKFIRVLAHGLIKYTLCGHHIICQPLFF